MSNTKLIYESDSFKIEFVISEKSKTYIHITNKFTTMIISKSELINNRFVFYGNKLHAIALLYNNEYFNIVNAHHSLFELTEVSKLKLI